MLVLHSLLMILFCCFSHLSSSVKDCQYWSTEGLATEIKQSARNSKACIGNFWGFRAFHQSGIGGLCEKSLSFSISMDELDIRYGSLLDI